MTRRSGAGYALGAAAAFSVAGTLGAGLMAAGWSAGAAACARILIGAVVLLPWAVLAMRGRWGRLRGGLPPTIAYGLFAVAWPQFAYFQAVRYLPVAVALLVEFTAPVVVLVWLWATRGQRPSRRTVLGAAVALAGLVVVLDLVAGVSLDVRGIGWALGAMVGLASFFVLSSDDPHGLPPVALAAGGLLTAGAALALGLAGGVLDLSVSRESPLLAGREVPWWLVLGALGVLSGGLSYALSIAAARRLGSRLASFVGLTEVLFVAVVAWLLLGEVPTPAQAAGGVLVVAGIVLVRLGEPETRAADPGASDASDASGDAAEVTRRPAVRGEGGEVSQ